MAEKKRPKGPFTASFIYTDEILEDFMAVYLIKKQVHPGTRVVCAAGGLAGILYFGYALYAQGMSVARIGYLMTCSLLLLVAVAGGRDRNDGTTDKYKQYYAGRKVDFRIDEEGVRNGVDAAGGPEESGPQRIQPDLFPVRVGQVLLLYHQGESLLYRIKGGGLRRNGGGAALVYADPLPEKIPALQGVGTHPGRTVPCLWGGHAPCFCHRSLFRRLSVNARRMAISSCPRPETSMVSALSRPSR